MRNIIDIYTIEDMKRHFHSRNMEIISCFILKESIQLSVKRDLFVNPEDYFLEKYIENDQIYCVSELSFEDDMIEEVIGCKYGRYTHFYLISDDLEDILEKIKTSYEKGRLEKELFETYTKQIKSKRLDRLFSS